MGGVDILEQKISYYDTDRRCSRWTFKLTLFILNIYSCNAHIIYKKQKIGSFSRLNSNLFLSTLIYSMAEKFNLTQSTKIAHSIQEEEQEQTRNENSYCLLLTVVNTVGDQTGGSLQKGKKKKPEIIIVEEDDFDYSLQLHAKSTTLTRLRFSLCYRKEKNTKTNDFCKKC
ncbi:hypothetical protein CDIK_3501 [Cucumispora dikerogammari]|nr:hypothetical protein CDIK_3501 [Cucumispora dikerogammari]